MTLKTPLVALPSDTYVNSGFLYHSLGDKYARALAEVAKVLPLLVPSMPDVISLDAMLAHVDGVLVTGAASNVHPPLYGETPTTDHEPYDHHRDSSTLNIIKACIARGIPLFCICRGFQELNVVMGGTLETELQRGEGRLDHRAVESEDVNVRYAQRHAIHITKGSFLETTLGKSETMVNTIHRQGIKKLGDGLNIEAVAPDGIIEAISVKDAKNFAFGTQWHPEFRASENPDSVKLFEAFGKAVKDYAASKQASQ